VQVRRAFLQEPAAPTLFIHPKYCAHPFGLDL